MASNTWKRQVANYWVFVTATCNLKELTNMEYIWFMLTAMFSIPIFYSAETNASVISLFGGCFSELQHSHKTHFKLR